MERAEERIRQWAREGKALSLPEWNDLPTIPLYMDQVLLYLGENLRFFEQDEDASLLTSSMINNYVKNGAVPHPEKKKYRREHLAALLTVCLLKQVLSLQEIRTLFEDRDEGEAFFSLFRETHTRAVNETCASLCAGKEGEEDLRLTALRLAAEANAKQAAARKILLELGKTEKNRLC